MKPLKLLLIGISFILIFSCTNDNTDIKASVDKFADLECRAMTLREKRFELANKIRFTQDSILHPAPNRDTVSLRSKLTELNKEKDVLLTHSLSLADTIKNQLNELMRDKLATQQDRANFDQMLNAVLTQRGCLKKS